MAVKLIKSVKGLNAPIKALKKSLKVKWKGGNKTAIEVRKIMITRKLKMLEKAQANLKTAEKATGSRKQDLIDMASIAQLEARKINVRKFSIKKDYGKDFNVKAYKELMSMSMGKSDWEGAERGHKVWDQRTRFNLMFTEALYKLDYNKNDPEETMAVLQGFTPAELYDAWVAAGGKLEKGENFYDKLIESESFLSDLLKAAGAMETSHIRRKTNVELDDMKDLLYGG